MDVRYPIGRFENEEKLTNDILAKWIQDLEDVPAQLREAVSGLNDGQLDTAYRPGGWTVRQVVHHLADSHINSYIRFKLAITENNPTIKPYQEEKWAELHDSRLPVEVSLKLMDAIHVRWVALIRSLDLAELEKTFLHPDSGSNKLWKSVGLYAWHGRHHVAHITTLRQRLGWF